MRLDLIKLQNVVGVGRAGLYKLPRYKSAVASVAPAEPKSEYDVAIVGGGHNGLIAAAYLQKAGKSVAVFEKRHIVGGAACTEEIVPGFKFSRASYVLSLLRPHIYADLELKKHGLRVFIRDPNCYTPIDPQRFAAISGSTKLRSDARSLLLGRSSEMNKQNIAKFSRRDAERYDLFDHWLQRMAAVIDPLLEMDPPSFDQWRRKSWLQLWRDRAELDPLVVSAKHLASGSSLAEFQQLLTAPIVRVLDQWFESEPLRASLATDGVIGAMVGPYSPGSGYVLLHHVMGQCEGIAGAWGYVQGGMGELSGALASAATAHGAHVFTNMEVAQIDTDAAGRAVGLSVANGRYHVRAKMVLSNCTPHVTYRRLLSVSDQQRLSGDFMAKVDSIDYTSPVTKINVALRGLPNFAADPTTGVGPMPHHRCTIHLNCEHVDILHGAFADCQRGQPSSCPMIDMTIPSSLDPTLAPPGCHVALLFTQYTPYELTSADGTKRPWTQDERNAYVERVFDCVERYAPGFRSLVVGQDVLMPRDLERVFGLTGGNLFHGAMSLDQLFWARPTAEFCGARTAVPGLLLCGSGAHPGGGVMGAAGFIAARQALKLL